MAEPLPAVPAAARARWMIRGDPATPDDPLTAGQPAAEADLRLLAIAGQYQRLHLPPRPPKLQARTDLPTLTMPYLPEPIRPALRRLIWGQTDHAAQEALATFTARRGFVLHPADCLPRPNADLPEVYAPWQHWQLGAMQTIPALDAATWLDFPRPDRLRRFVALRQGGSAYALALLGQHFAACPAEERVDLVRAIATGTGEEDAGFLAGLANDRSEKVRQMAQHLLARLGKASADCAAEEAASMFKVTTTGLLRRQKVLRLNPKAKQAQIRSLVSQLPTLTPQSLAQALGLATEAFVQLWKPEEVPLQVQIALTELIAAYASAIDVAGYWAVVRDGSAHDMACLALHYSRLAPEDRHSALIWAAVKSGLEACSMAHSLGGPVLSAAVSAAFAAQRGSLADLQRTASETASARLSDQLAKADTLARLAAQLEQALTVRLAKAAEAGIALLETLAARTDDAASLLAALPPLVDTMRYGTARDMSRGPLIALAELVALQAALGLPYAACNLDAATATALSASLAAAHRALTLADFPADIANSWIAALFTLSDAAQTARSVAGCATRLLYEAGRITPDEAARHIGLALSVGRLTLDAAAYFEGFFAGASQRLIHDTALRIAVDQWMQSLDEADFIAALPLFRRVFSELGRAERHMLKEAALSGQTAPAPPVAEDNPAWEAHLALLTRILTGGGSR